MLYSQAHGRKDCMIKNCYCWMGGIANQTSIVVNPVAPSLFGLMTLSKGVAISDIVRRRLWLYT